MECSAMLLNWIPIHWTKAGWPLLSKNKASLYYWTCMSTAPWSMLVKVLALRMNGNNFTELRKHCNEYGSLFLAPLWLWCLTMWALAASILSLTVCRWVLCICCGFGSSAEAGILYNFPSFCVAQSSESIGAETSILASALNLKHHNVLVYNWQRWQDLFTNRRLTISNLTTPLTKSWTAKDTCTCNKYPFTEVLVSLFD